MKLYVGNLAYTISETDLQDLFKPFGEVQTVKIITDRYSGQAKGFGFVEMSTREEGQKAIDGLNGTTLQSRQIVVNEARPQSPKKGGGGGGGKRNSSRRW